MKHLLALLIVLLASPQALRADADRPNIILLFADDQRADTIGAHGNPHISTPHLDALVSSGFSFRNNYCAGSFSGAVCVASRAMLMTGRHWMQIPSTDKAYDWRDLPLLPSILRTEGNYNTFIVGKWHNGKQNLERAFQSGHSVYMGGMANHAEFQVQDLTDGKLVNKRDADGFSSTVYADAAIDYLQNADRGQPFFLYVALTAPHDPRNPPEEYRQQYYDSPPPLPENFLPLHPFKNGPQANRGRDESLAPWPRTEEVVRDQLCEYYGLITHLDEQIGRITKALRDSPHAIDTYVIYTADHGLAMGSHGLLGKQNIYEQSMKCPLIINGPAIPSGQSSEAFTYVHDLYATILSMADLEVPSDADSHNLRPMAQGTAETARRSLFLPYQDNQRSINDGRWKLHIYPKINHRLLFDLENDPHETNNLAANPKYQTEIARLEALMQQWQTELGDSTPLSSSNPERTQVEYSNENRSLDVWQPVWIRDKYFGGRSDPDHGVKR